MSYILLFLCICTAYGAQRQEHIEMDSVKGPPQKTLLEELDTVSHHRLHKKIVSLKGQNKILIEQNFFLDPYTITRSWRSVVHISEFIEHALLLSALRSVKDDVASEDTCLCTTLESTAALSAVLEELQLKAHVGLTQGCLGEKTPQFKNDFSQILEKNKDKNVFIFVSTTSQSALPAGEFLVQLTRSGALKEHTKIIFCAGAKSYDSSYAIGSIHYGQGRVQDHDSFLPQLATRAAQAERMAAGNPCDACFLESSEFKRQYALWTQTLAQHAIQTCWGAMLNGGAICSTQNPNNVLELNNPDHSLKTLTKYFGKRGRDNQRTVKADILIGAPKERCLNLLEKSCIFGCGIRLFLNLRSEGADVRYVFDDSNIYHESLPKLIPNAGDRVLLCAGPKHFGRHMSRWIKRFSAITPSKYATESFVPCDSLGPHSPYINHAQKTLLVDYPLEPVHEHLGAQLADSAKDADAQRL